MKSLVRVAVRVEGVVQGVGFRPFVHSLASRFGLAGRVGNDTGGVFIDAEGAESAVAGFLSALRHDAPRLADIQRVTVTEQRPRGGDDFTIVASESAGPRNALVSSDSATCAACLAELRDPTDRRYRYPFLNCTDCGPRFTIVRDVPYDRPNTTMAGFSMCDECAEEYHDPRDRRFHAQPVCCPRCGPSVRLVDNDRAELSGDPIRRAADLLRDGRVLAVKGLGGYHLAAAADSDAATAALRRRKHREDKPFAVMVPTLRVAQRLCEVDAEAQRLLTGHRRPIVLLDRRDDTDSVAAAVAPDNRQLGLMLPYTPLHHLLTELTGPIVLTSGNVSDEPIAFGEDDALDRLGGIADAFLTHDRAIHVRTDDSVVRPWRGRPLLLRRSRGYAPEPLSLPWVFPRPVLACGAEQKNTFCLAKDSYAFCSQHIGDLENYQTLKSFTESIEHFRGLFDIEPVAVAHDLHPDYLSTRYASQLRGVELVGVQHHHAHIAACLADNSVAGPTIGVAFDGTGYGTDGTIWGGEFLLATLAGFERAGHLEPVPLPGGQAAIRQPWRMAASYLDSYRDLPLELLPVVRRNERQWRQVVSMARNGVNAPLTSSVGRLFDAVAAVLDIRDTVNYEGQAAIELEQHADPKELGSYPLLIGDGEPIRVCGARLVRAVVDDLLSGTGTEVVAARFHNTLAQAITSVCTTLGERTGVRTVALSGGVFCNTLLLDRAVDALVAEGMTVLTHSRVPCNDGGISFGQAAVVGALDREWGCLPWQ
ncbi:(NiFe) hydrogenase maturation protein HypF [Saccharomonospora marina XMU15]|uniref:Carbamoyltransferase n=1 Tax=Saccharomonospora marina XMU15 TaxID=882083 RepID=H5WWC9_9PSEU|nr:carbamoyltransferase HypF [Saccharomonospora marina]EHR49411.1 (NiFe) hydrogenase maturation protein HypF [Saccharomonospora marina XMU15]